MKSIDKLILGTVQLGLPYGINNNTGQPGNNEAFEILACAQQNGIDTLDTANAYGDAERIIGEFHKTQPVKFKINTKFQFVEDQDLKASTFRTINTLDISSIDTYMYHKYADLQNKQAKFILATLKNEGVIKKTGISIYSNKEFTTAIDTEFIDVIQIPFNLLDNYTLRGALIEKAKQNGKEIHIRSVFLQGLFFMQEDKIPEILYPLKRHISHLQKIASENNISINTLALVYALSINNIDKVLIGVDSLAQLQNNLKSVDANISSSVVQAVNNIKVEEIDLLNPVNWK